MREKPNSCKLSFDLHIHARVGRGEDAWDGEVKHRCVCDDWSHNPEIQDYLEGPLMSTEKKHSRKKHRSQEGANYKGRWKEKGCYTRSRSTFILAMRKPLQSTAEASVE